jgi:hypothetical protein
MWCHRLTKMEHVGLHSERDSLGNSTTAADAAAATVYNVLQQNDLPVLHPGGALDRRRQEIQLSVQHLHQRDRQVQVEFAWLGFNQSSFPFVLF